MIEDEPKIGKHVLALLTTGMYKEPRLIYREYIQNSADQIDLLPEEEKTNQNRCRIVIDIDREKARVTVKDFATGIKAREFKKRLLAWSRRFLTTSSMCLMQVRPLRLYISYIVVV